MARRRGLSVRLQLTLSYAAVVVVTGGLLLLVVRVFLLRYVPDPPRFRGSQFLVGPTRHDLVEAFMPRAEQAMVVLLVFGLVGGWLLAGLAGFAGRARIEVISTTTHGACVAVTSGDRLALPIIDYEFAGPDEVGEEYRKLRGTFRETFSPDLPGGLNVGRQLL